MRTLQYCYFALKSEVMSAEAITDRLLMRPDEVKVMGSRNPALRLPRCHVWKIVRRSTESVDEQIQHIVDRLSPLQPGLVALVAKAEVSAVMQVVRYFHHERGVEAPSEVDPLVAERAPRPLGWNLSLSMLEFLTSVRAMLDVDEYDLSDEDDVTGR
jgi:Domain of unknown function (DUF4279)